MPNAARYYRDVYLGENGLILFADADEFDSDGDIHQHYTSETDIFENTRVIFSPNSTYSTSVGDSDGFIYRSNFARLREDFDLPLLWGFFDGSRLFLDITDLDPESEEWDPTSGEKMHLLEILIRISDEYPIYDEEDYSAREWENYEIALQEEVKWVYRSGSQGLNYTDVDYIWDDEILPHAVEFANQSNEFYPEVPDGEVILDAIHEAVLLVYTGSPLGRTPPQEESLF